MTENVKEEEQAWIPPRYTVAIGLRNERAKFLMSIDCPIVLNQDTLLKMVEDGPEGLAESIEKEFYNYVQAGLLKREIIRTLKEIDPKSLKKPRKRVK